MHHKTRFALFIPFVLGFATGTAAAQNGGGVPLEIVTTIPDYAWAAEQIGGDRVEVASIARGNQDAHFVRPKPSYAAIMRRADLFVTTGLDLELWVPALLDAAGNKRILEGGPGYVSAWTGIELLDAPTTLSRTEGDVHIYGNPHIHTDPLNMAMISRNLLAGMIKVDPDHASYYEGRQKELEERIYRRLFGDELVGLLGGEVLARLSRSNQLLSFLEAKEYPKGSGSKLIDRLGGWMKEAEPLRGRKIIAYHKNWIYFTNRFGLEVAGYIEPKPGIPPTPRHVEEILKLIEDRNIKVILAANYFDPEKPTTIAERTGARAVIVALSTGGEPGVEDYFKLVDTWISRVLEAFRASDVSTRERAP